MKAKEIRLLLHRGEVITQNGKQLSYDKTTYQYVVRNNENEFRTISILAAINEMI